MVNNRSLSSPNERPATARTHAANASFFMHGLYGCQVPGAGYQVLVLGAACQVLGAECGC
jgi:hypothetical protein